MASADAIWRTFLQPISARDDNSALMWDVGILRPKETGIYGSKPGFCRMHQLITYNGICRRLDCWRVAAKKHNSVHLDLDAFAVSEPSFDDLKTMADQLACNYIANHGLQRTRKAIRYHILVNPTGKKGKFRAVDWCIELNNLFTKVINGGKGSNRTVDRIILESPLVQVYRNLHGAFE
ncbi:hypothetical protein BD769DRAFT_1678897 [Suillus cothurnatus]|nr:hypothetical protein BD769DRAFT_1678897 [Suillus cothurnatus]